jgi:hypothetical protein
MNLPGGDQWPRVSLRIKRAKFLDKRNPVLLHQGGRIMLSVAEIQRVSAINPGIAALTSAETVNEPRDCGESIRPEYLNVVFLRGIRGGGPGWHLTILNEECPRFPTDPQLLGSHPLRYSFLVFDNFQASDRWTKKTVHCIYQALIVAIATRHADAIDVKFIVDGRPVWVALPLPAWSEYKKRTGKIITDSLAVEIAGHYLKHALESGEGVGREMYSLSVDDTLRHLEAAVQEMEATPATASS